MSDVIAIIQTILAIGAFIFAYQEFRKWRTELLGSKKIELAIRLGKAAIEVRETFRFARNPFGYSRKDAEYKPGSTPEEKRRQEKEYEFNQRIQPLNEKMRQLQEILWEVSILFKERDNVEKQITALNNKYRELHIAMVIALEGEITKEDRQILYGDPSGDEFSQVVDEATNELLTLARRYTQ